MHPVGGHSVDLAAAYFHREGDFELGRGEREPEQSDVEIEIDRKTPRNGQEGEKLKRMRSRVDE